MKTLLKIGPIYNMDDYREKTLFGKWMLFGDHQFIDDFILDKMYQYFYKKDNNNNNNSTNNISNKMVQDKTSDRLDKCHVRTRNNSDDDSKCSDTSDHDGEKSFFALTELDDIWYMVGYYILNGLLGNCTHAKVSTAISEGFAASDDVNTGVICLYTYDYTNKLEVLTVAQNIRKYFPKKFARDIYYKTDRQTYNMQYVRFGKKSSVYLHKRNEPTELYDSVTHKVIYSTYNR